MSMAESLSIGQELIRSGVTVASVLIGARLALRTYRSNQWWDARHKTYEKAIEILDRLAGATHEYRMRLRYVIDYGDDPCPSEILQALDKAATDFHDATRDLKSLTSRGRFNMSIAARMILVRTLEEMTTHQNLADSQCDELSAVRHELLNAIRQFSYAAQVDLQVLSLRTRIESVVSKFVSWSIWIISALIYWFRVFGLRIWFGQEKGRQLGKKLRGPISL